MATFGVSPSRQLQWEMFPTNSDGTITILRNPRAERIGMANGRPWLIGARHFDHGVGQSFCGWMGDVRIVDRALGPHEWLSARR